ncbi:porin [Photobacterium halotolerans]|uniref:Porin n=1 Tax=Photobacterium halotolerans TaxID=265726 RepID=A0A7X4WPG7_9GAMM|nr:porin [Photobacterium halotolerans]NAW65394.1 porin [Photobacterium halotolerans]NAW86428.1 porin [Photobacterium halotolerans]
MENVFKRSVLGIAVAAAATMAASAQAAPATDSVDLYGQVAVSVWQFGEDKIGGGDAPLKVENESRFGLRGSKDLARGPNLIWQLEGGDVGDNGGNSGLGVRDTFVGVSFDDGGKVRLGRMLTPLYEMIDWPYSGQRAGAIFDWGGDVLGGARYDRQSNMVRYDSGNYSGFTFNLAAGRGAESDKESNFYGVGAHYSTGMITLHAGYELGQDRNVSALSDFYSTLLAQQPGNPATFTDIEGSLKSDTDAYLVGFELNLGDFGLYGAFKSEAADYNDGTITVDGTTVNVAGNDMDQDSYSIGAVYSGVANWQFKANYAANLAADVNGNELSGSEDYIVSAQALYFLDDSAITYVRPYMISKNDSDAEFGWGWGVEYYF